MALGFQKQTIEVKMRKVGEVHVYEHGKSRHAVPAHMAKQLTDAGKSPPTLAVKSGDTLVFRNAGTVYYKPFTYAIGNKFETGKKGLPPGGTKSVVLRNPSSTPLLVIVRDDIHSRTAALVIVVLPEKGEAERAPKPTFAGTWDSDFGRMQLQQDGDTVRGSYDYKGGSKIEGKIDEQGRLQFKWTEPEINGTPGRHGTGTFELSPDGKRLVGSWNYTLSDGSKGNGGGWGAKRTDPKETA